MKILSIFLEFKQSDIYLLHFTINFLSSYLLPNSYKSKALFSFMFILEIKIFIKLLALNLNKIKKISLNLWVYH